MKPSPESRAASVTAAICGGGLAFLVALALALWKARTMLPSMLREKGPLDFKEDPLKLWQHAHGASVHFPIALAFVALLFDAGALLLRRPQWRPVGFWCLLTGALTSIPACLSGLTAQLGWFGFEKWEAESLLHHRNVALTGAGMLMALSLWRIVAKDRLSIAAQWVYAYLAAAAIAVILFTGYLGGYVARGY